jgi:hypothetical protein
MASLLRSTCRKTGKSAAQSPQNPERALAKLRKSLGKFGNTMFVAEPVELQLAQAWFLPVGAMNALRREAAEAWNRPAAPATRARRAPCRPPIPFPTRRRN